MNALKSATLVDALNYRRKIYPRCSVLATRLKANLNKSFSLFCHKFDSVSTQAKTKRRGEKIATVVTTYTPIFLLRLISLRYYRPSYKVSPEEKHFLLKIHLTTLSWLPLFTKKGVFLCKRAFFSGQLSTRPFH